jgi:DNA repair exonuclease SbcCD ATPase subunit
VALEKTRKELGVKEKELIAAQSALGYLQNTQNQQIKDYDTYHMQLAQYHEMIGVEGADVNAKITRIEEAIANCRAYVNTYTLKIQELRNAPITIDKEQIDAQKGIIQKAEELIAGYELEIKQLQKDLTQDVYVDAVIAKQYNDSKTNLKLLDQELKTLARNIQAKETQITLVESRIGVPCKECSRPISQNEVNAVLENYATEVLKLIEEQALVRSEYVNREIDDNNISQEYAEAYQKAIDAGQQKALINGKIGKLNFAISACRVDIRNAQQKILALEESARKTINNEIIHAQTDMANWQIQIPNYEKQIIQVKHAFELLRAEESKYLEKIDKVTAQMQSSIVEIKKKEATVICITDDIAYLRYWEKAFGYQGIRAVLLDDVAAKLTETANNYLKEMMGGTLWIDCHTQSSNKDGEKRERFEVQTFNSFGAGTYYGNSKGEQQRIDIALSLALHDIARTRSNSPIGFTIFDEVFERLDEAGCDSIIRLLHKERNAFGTVFVVSHNPNLTIRFPKSIEFVKQNGITSLVKKEEIKCVESKPVSIPMEKTIAPTRRGRPRKNSTAKPV